MRLLVTGITGFIGRALGTRLARGGHELVALTRNPDIRLPFPVSLRSWDDTGSLEDIEAVIHLAGESIAARRWSRTQKETIQKSRTQTAARLGELVTRMRAPRVLLSASAVGFYGDRGDEWLVEGSAPGTGFLAETCVAWERAVSEINIPRKVILRTGLVLGRGGGALEKMLPLFRAGLGGRIGSGRQWMSWIQLEDLVELYCFALNETGVNGPLNAVAPNPATNREFTRELAHALHRPALFPVPALALTLALGEMSELLLASQRVRESVSARGFRFRHETLKSSLRELVS